MYDSQYEYIATLQYRVKSLQAQVDAFKSGAKYKQMEDDYRSLLNYEENRIHKLEVDLSKAHSQVISVRNKWWETLDDVTKEHKKELVAKNRIINDLEKRVTTVERQRDDALDKVTQQRHELYEVKTAIEEEKGKNRLPLSEHEYAAINETRFRIQHI